MTKRVICLYRVSTAGQVYMTESGGDIPMQKTACRDFVRAHPDWVLIDEFEEKGVSASKVSAYNREEVKKLMEKAENHEFDVLLVFMFDRIGRMSYETPLIVQRFIENGVEVWSVKEGQMKLDDEMDKLVSFLDFWRAESESKKISARVKTRHEQLVSDGCYVGGVVPFGYKLEYKGRKNKHGTEMRDYAINEDEVEAVKKVFDMILNEGYGSHQISIWLNKNGYRTHKGKLFQSNNVLRMLHNEIYRGYIVQGNARSKRMEELQIIPDADFFRVRDFLTMRSGKNEEKRTIAMSNKTEALLGGNLYCAHCGCRLTTSRHKYADGFRPLYVCYHRSRRLNDCDGACTYHGDIIDDAVLSAVKMIFANIGGSPDEERIKRAYESAMKNNREEQRKLAASLEKDKKQLEALQDEIGKTLVGESLYSADDLSAAIKKFKDRISEDEARMTELKEYEIDKKAQSDSIIPSYKIFRTWATEFEESSFEAKKMIISQLFSRIEVNKDYKIHMEMNILYKQFCEDWIMTG